MNKHTTTSSSAAVCALILVFFGGILASRTAAADIKECDGVLAPTVESFNQDYAILQSYAKTNASDLYNEIEKSENRSAGASASYGPYGVDYRGSNNKSEFILNVNNRLNNEKFFLSESEARSYYRKGISDPQIKAWTDCVARETNGGAILLAARNVDNNGFHLIVTWIPPVSVGSSMLELRAQGGTIDGSEELTVTMIGRGAKTYNVKSNNGAPVRVLANIAGATDSLIVSPAIAKPTPRLVTRERICSEDEPCSDAKRVTGCLSSSERPSEVKPGTWLVSSQSSNYASAEAKTRSIKYGKWENEQCKLSGSGWHANIGSCGTGKGDGWQRCDQVRVEVESFE